MFSKVGTKHLTPNMKPDFNLDLLRSNNYICHLFVVRRILMEKIGGFRKEFDGAQDYDFILRCTEEAEKIAHVHKVLYHWRTHEKSTSDNPESKIYAFHDHIVCTFPQTPSQSCHSLQIPAEDLFFPASDPCYPYSA